MEGATRPFGDGEKMAEKRVDIRIICPFYLSSFRHIIRCASVNSAQSTDSTFRSVAERNAYIDDFCGSRCWQSCVVAQMCIQKYDEENNEK